MLSLGEQLKRLDNEDTEQRRLLVEHARQQHAEFWKKWYSFRCTQTGDDNGHAFWHVVDLLDCHRHPKGTRGLFATFMQPGPRTLVIDIAAGARPSMLDVLADSNSSLVGYVVLEPEINGSRVRENFQNSPHHKLFEMLPWDFWERFPTDRLSEIIRARKAERIITMTYWGATYLPAREIRSWVKAALSVSDTVYINMLTHGKFQPEVLKKKYVPFLLKLLLKRKVKLKEALRAISAVKTTVRFGNEFAQLMPLWNAEELQRLLSDICTISNLRQDVMWGQTTFVELNPYAN
jgi:hypothetical protein